MSRAHKDCKYCGDNTLSSSLSKHLKQVHAAAVAREEKQLRDHAARCFGNAGKSQTKKGTRGKDNNIESDRPNKYLLRAATPPCQNELARNFSSVAASPRPFKPEKRWGGGVPPPAPPP
jgi:hypothetical protein